MHQQRDLIERWMILCTAWKHFVDTAENGAIVEIRPPASNNPGGATRPHRTGPISSSSRTGRIIFSLLLLRLLPSLEPETATLREKSSHPKPAGVDCDEEKKRTRSFLTRIQHRLSTVLVLFYSLIIMTSPQSTILCFYIFCIFESGKLLLLGKDRAERTVFSS